MIEGGAKRRRGAVEGGIRPDVVYYISHTIRSPSVRASSTLPMCGRGRGLLLTGGVPGRCLPRYLLTALLGGYGWCHASHITTYMSDG